VLSALFTGLHDWTTEFGLHWIISSFSTGHFLTHVVTYNDSITKKKYIGMWRSEVNIRIFRVVDATAFAIGIIRRGQLGKVATGPSVDCEPKNHNIESNEGHETEFISDFSFVIYSIKSFVPLTGPL
jgi:hypothetical protein